MVLWVGGALSGIGSSIAGISLPLLVLSIGGTPIELGIIDALLLLPYPVLSLAAGAMVDRWDRRKTMIWCDFGRALIASSIPIALVAGTLTVPQLYAVALLSGILFVFFDLANVSSLTKVVPMEQLGDAVGKGQTAAYTSGLLGPTLGGALYGVQHTIPFVVDVISYAASVVGLALVRGDLSEQRTTGRMRLRLEIVEGIRWLWRHKLFRFMVFYSAGINLVIGNGGLILIILARQQHASPATIGIIFSLAGLGGIPGSVIAPWIQQRLSYGQAIIGTGVLIALLWPLYAAAPNALLLGGVNVALALVTPTLGVVGVSYRLAQTPNDLQGRVNAAIRLVTFSAPPLGAVVVGILLRVVGGKSTVLLLGGFLAVLTLLLVINPHVRHAPAAQRDTAG